MIAALAFVASLATPGYAIDIDVRCPEGEVACDDVRYAATDKSSGQVLALTGRTLHRPCADGVTPCRFLGYEFAAGRLRYRVLDEGRLQVYRGDRLVTDEKGVWKR